MPQTRKLYIFIATSLDGYIAKTGDDLSFLSMVEKEGEDYGYAAFKQTIDTVIIGRRTYDWVMAHMPESPYTGNTTYVITKTPRQDAGDVRFYTGDLVELVKELKLQEGKNIFCDGGAEVIDALLKADLIDEFTISVIPVLLGEGVRLFKDGRPEQTLQLKSARSFDTGVAQLHYVRRHDPQAAPKV